MAPKTLLFFNSDKKNRDFICQYIQVVAGVGTVIVAVLVRTVAYFNCGKLESASALFAHCLWASLNGAAGTE